MPEFAKRLEYMERTAGVMRALFGAMSNPEDRSPIPLFG